MTNKSTISKETYAKRYSYKACVFLEGSDDILFWKTIVSKLKEESIVLSDFEEKGIGLISVGGDNVKCWIDMGTMKRLSNKFIFIKDSDKKKASDPVRKTLLNWKTKCECDGGELIYTRKREIENYLHPRVIQESRPKFVTFDDFSDMEQLFGPNIIKEIVRMNANEILEMDKYIEGGIEHHELKEIIEKILALT